MSSKFIKIHPGDNVLVALTDLRAGESITYNGTSIALSDNVPAKHKFTLKEMHPDDEIMMYGVLVGKALKPIPAGGVIGTHNVKHKSADFSPRTTSFRWQPPIEEVGALDQRRSSRNRRAASIR